MAIANYAFGDIEAGRADVYDYYSAGGDEVAKFVASEVSGGADAVKATVRSFANIGADELILYPATDHVDEVARLADTVL